MVIDPKKSLAAAAEVYNPSKGWATLAQRLDGISPKEYVSLAHYAEPNLQAELIKFCEKNRLSYAVIPHSEFLQYEGSTQDFKRWYVAACTKHGQNPQADVMVMTRVKMIDSAERKNQFDPTSADRVKDYLGGMLVFMQGNTPKSKRDSVDRMAASMSSMQDDERTLGINNLFWKPLKHGYRAFKSAWEIYPSQETGWSEFPILSSIKIQHESQMGIDRLTRRFMSVQRATTKVLSTFWEKNGSPTDHDAAKNTRSHMNRAEKRASGLEHLGRALYDIVHDRAGLNRLINPDLMENHLPRDAQYLCELIKSAGTPPGHSFTEEIHAQDIFPLSLRGRAAHGEHIKLVKKHD